MNRTGKYLLWLGIVLQLALLLRYGAIIVGAIRVFNPGNGVASPDMAALDANRALVHDCTVVGRIFASVGIALVMAALFMARPRGKRLFIGLCAICLLWIGALCFPRTSPYIGVPRPGVGYAVIGSVLAVYAATPRRECLTRRKGWEETK